MVNKGTIFLQDSQIQGVLANFLKLRVTGDKADSFGAEHLDEDTTAAFVEGNLNFRQSESVVKHLVICSFCRHITAELVKLDLAFAEAEAPRSALSENTEPAKISEVLGNLLSRIFGTSDNAVFAHQETEKEAESIEKADEKS